MQEIIFQKKGKTAIPFSREDLEKWNNYKENQTVKAKVYGVKKLRSLQQHKWAMRMIRTVAENIDDPEWNSFERAKKKVKLAMKFFTDEVIVEGNKVYFELRSFAFSEMEAPEANIIYNNVKMVCAQRLGCTPEELEADTKRRS